MEPRNTPRTRPLPALLVAFLASSALCIQVRAAQPSQQVNNLPLNDTASFIPHKPAEPQSDDPGPSTDNQLSPPPSALPAKAEPTCIGDPLCGNAVAVQWYQAHGWLMWIGFGLFLPFGIIASRHLQSITKAWFFIHVSCMAVAMAAIIAGVVIAYSKFDAMDMPPGDAGYMHAQFGTAVFVVSCVNFVLGLIRPKEGVKIRVPWYLLHFTCGTCVVGFAWYTIYTGMDAYAVNWVSPAGSTLHDLQSFKNWFTASIVVLAFVYLLLGRWDYMMGRTDKGSTPEGFTSLVLRKEMKKDVLPKTAAIEIPQQ